MFRTTYLADWMRRLNERYRLEPVAPEPEKRRAARVPAGFSVERLAGARAFSYLAEDISAHGVRLRMPPRIAQPSDLGLEEVYLRFQLPGEPEARWGLGRVVRRGRDHHGPMAVVAWTLLSGETHAAIETYVTAHAMA